MNEENLPAFEDTEELPSFEQTEELPSFENTQDIPMARPENNVIPSELKGAGLGSVVGAIPGLTAELGGFMLEKASKARSPYTEEQLNLLTSEYGRLKDLNPEETMAKVGGQVSQKNRNINELEKQAYANLSEPVTEKEYRKAAVLSTKPLTREIDPNTPEFLKAQEELTKIPQTVNPIAKQEQEQLEKYATKKASEIIENKRKSNLGLIPEEALLQEYNELKNQIKQTKEGFTFKPNMEKALKDFQDEKIETKKLQKSGKEAAYRKLETPLAKEFPELKNRLYSSAYATAEKDLEKILGRYKSGEVLRGEDAYKIVRDIRSAAFDLDGNLRIDKEVAEAVQKGLRDLVGEKNPEASALFRQMSEQIEDLKRLEKTGYIKRDKSVSKASEDFIKFGKTQQSKIIKDIAPNLYASGVDVSGDVVARLAELKKNIPEKLYKELELAVLKIAMDDPAKKATLSNWDLALATAMPQLSGFRFGAKYISSPEGSLKAYRAAQKIRGAAKPLIATGAAAGGLIGGIGAQAAEEALDPETSGALPTELDLPVTYENAPIPADLKSLEGIQSSYWFERGVRDPEEQRQRALLASFREGLPAQGRMDEMPSAYEKPEIRQRKEQVMAAKKAGALAPNYVEAPKAQVLKADNPAEIASVAQALQTGTDKASQEYSRVLSQITDASPREKESILFGLNQQPEFRRLVRKAKGEENIED